ncbi:MAG: hypothetical protein QF664_02560 [Dehalococcoidia bacterium]|nr:hypothetical protein [Dehalococcoidia bacterium]
MRTVTIDDIIALEGPRTPSSATAQKTFRLGTLVFGDRAYTEADYTFITLALKYFESDKQYDGNGTPPWKAATLGTSTVTAALPAPPVSATVVTPGATPAPATTPAPTATPTTTPATTPTTPSSAAGTPKVAVPPPGGRTFVQAGTTDIAALIAAQLFEVLTVWKFDFGTQRYVVFIVGAPSFANSLSTLLPTDIVELVSK